MHDLANIEANNTFYLARSVSLRNNASKVRISHSVMYMKLNSEKNCGRYENTFRITDNYVTGTTQCPAVSSCR